MAGVLSLDAFIVVAHLQSSSIPLSASLVLSFDALAKDSSLFIICMYFFHPIVSLACKYRVLRRYPHTSRFHLPTIRTLLQLFLHYITVNSIFYMSHRCLIYDWVLTSAHHLLFFFGYTPAVDVRVGDGFFRRCGSRIV
ncbi:hypothetical protein BDN72DRAFT_6650 [Pluteus cervinus]|uniref:Uncharacterized protein n=1 Tax=Pluteus cervinus TaxID=181527 RepID=A0ACD3BFR2_9AGAR|nr:hypothetical protein BDN72DRAFT_6650 [Pluteus cervinus]